MEQPGRPSPARRADVGLAPLQRSPNVPVLRRRHSHELPIEIRQGNLDDEISGC